MRDSARELARPPCTHDRRRRRRLHRPAARAATPHLTALLTKKTINVSGADDLRAGRVQVDVRGRGIVEIVTFKRGYDVTDFTADVNKFGAKNDIKALKRALKNSTIVGGFRRRHRHGRVPEAGRLHAVLLR